MDRTDSGGQIAPDPIDGGKGPKMTASKTIIRFILFSVLCLIPTEQGRTQSTDLIRLQDEIRRNEELIKQAEILVRETNSVKARASLKTAIYLHEESKNLLTVQNRPILAARAVEKAREAVLRAIALAKQEAKKEENAKRAIERASGRLERAKHLLAETEDRGSNPAGKLIQESQAHLGRSKDSMREHLFGAALRLAISSEGLSNQAIKLLKKDQVNLNNVGREFEKTIRLLERIDDYEDLSAHPRAERMYREARELQDRAHDQLQGGHPRIALEQTQKARGIAMNVIKILTSNPDADNVERAIDLTESLLERAEEMTDSHRSEKIRNKLAKSHEFQDNAKSRFSNGDYSRALRFTLRARETAKEAIASLERPLDPKEVEATLLETDELIEQLKANIDRADRTADPEILPRIISHQESAWMEFHRGRLKAALTRTKLARNLAHRILDRINEGRL